MAVLTTLEQLESVQAAITAIEGGAQSYQMGDVRVAKGNLSALYAREERLQTKYRRETRGQGVLTRPNWAQGATSEGLTSDNG